MDPANMAPRSGLLVVLSALVGCSSLHSRSARHTLPEPSASVAPAEKIAPPIPKSNGAHPVLTEAGVAYALLGETAAPAEYDEKIPMSGGWTLGIAREGKAGGEAFTLVGPGGSCVARASQRVSLSVDFGGSSGVALRGPTHDAVVLDGCDSLARSGSLLLALDGADRSAQWEPLVHLDAEEAPTDRALAEDEVWIHRYGMPGSDVDVIERTVIRYVAPACMEQEHDVILESEDGHPVASHSGFSLMGGIRTANGALVVLRGTDDPEALRVVRLSEVPSPYLLDARLGLLADGTGASC
jgi:hypothetical protein